MKLTKTQETEIWQVYDTWLLAYLNADVKTYGSYLADDYHFIGSTDNEEFLNKKDTTRFFENTAAQLAGRCDLRNEIKIIEKFESLVFVTHLFDAWFLNGNDYAYYGRFRFSNVLKENKEGWRFIYQHFSTTDSKTDEGETIGFNKVNAENIELKEAIKRRTVELQEKNRELEIEAALERIRSSAMSMDSSRDLTNTILILFKELDKLGVKTVRSGIGIFNDDSNKVNVWAASEDKNETIVNLSGDESLSGHALLEGIYEHWKKQADFEYVLHGEDLLEYYKHLSKTNLPIPAPVNINEEPIQYYRYTYFPAGGLFAFANQPFTDEAIKIMRRFAGVFHLAFMRHQDLMKAEAQKREAQIEAALEKVRSRSLGMQKSDELKEVIQVVYDQLVHLNINVEHTGFIMDYKENDDMHIWLADQQEVPSEITIPYFDSPHWNSFIEAKEKGINFFANLLTFEEKNKFYKDLFKLVPDVPEETSEYYFNCTGLAGSTVLLENVGLYIENFSGIPYTDDENKILMRFGKVFQQTYTRFLDLQKAEAQTREAQIEAALERVRSRSMAMHKSEELSETAEVLFEQINLLGKIPDRMSIGIINEESKNVELWVTDQGGNQLSHEFFFSLNEPTSIFKIYNAWKDRKDSFVVDLTGQKLQDWLLFVKENAKLPIDENKIIGRRVQQAAFFSQGFLLLTTHEPVTDEIMRLLVRFAKVFDQTYRRFLDLKKAEAQAREAQIEAALERVRSKSMAMHKSEELLDVISVVSEQLQQLDFKFIHVSFANNDSSQDYKFWTSSKGMPKPMRFNVPYLDIAMFNNMREAQEKSVSFYTDILTKEEHIQWHNHLLKHGGTNVFSKEENEYIMSRGMARSIAINPNIILILANYASIPYSEEDNKIIERFGQVFEQSYTRFLDLQKAEAQAMQAEKDLITIKAARQKAEEALTELQNTQKQLIQSEKMASLGELTAGIAHEIQNPLNFVNNFSEVSMELLDEMKLEIENGNLEDVKELAQNVIQNLEKINHHGKRADAIVKGMLQHSRSNSGTKEPTDINALCNEYLRLSYHGLRAKDKSFNAKLLTNFEDGLKKVNVIPQDLGRVVLNLLTNAFYACAERSRSAVNEKSSFAKASEDKNYEPTVSIATKTVGKYLEITVKDNGNGMPQNVVDKIFQPFFTTKPTGQGTGLGLSMSYDIITKGHGGALKVETEQNEGTEFIISLPIVKL